MEEWKQIPEFRRYSVSTHGRIRNDDTDKIMVLLLNKNENVHVGLVKDKVQCRRSVPKMVAQAFLPVPRNENFDTPIHLDGDPTNNLVENLQWRPLWFARFYKLQFRRGSVGFTNTLRDIATGDLYHGSWEASIMNGLLESDVVVAVNDKTYCFPTYQRFELVE